MFEQNEKEQDQSMVNNNEVTNSSEDAVQGQDKSPGESVTTPPQPAEPQQDLPSEPKKKSKLWLWVTVVVILVLVGVGGWFYYAKGQAMLLAKDIKWNWGVDYQDYSMNLNLDVNITDFDSGFSSIFGITNSVHLQLDGEHISSNSNLEGYSNIDITSEDKEVIRASLNYKKIGEVIYLSLVTGLIPDELQNKWLMLDKNDAKNNAVLPGANFDPDEYEKYVQDLNKKIDNLLQRGKDERWFILSDPHQIKDGQYDKLKKLDFKLNPDRIDEFSLAAIETLWPENVIEKTKSGYAEFKEDKSENWQNYKELLTGLDVSLWANTKTKEVQGVELVLEDFELKNNGEHASNISFRFSQMINSIEPKEIIAPTEIITTEELMEMFLGGMAFNINTKLGTDCIDEECAEEYTVDIDTDNDGLLDDDEINIYQTDPNNPDTDGDGYLDGEEVENGYNPLGEGLLKINVVIDPQFATPQVALDTFSLAINTEDVDLLASCFIDNKIRWDAEDITDAQEFIQGAREEAEAQEIRIELNGELSDYGNMYLGYGTMFFDDVIVDNKGMILLDQVSNGWKFYDFDF